MGPAVTPQSIAEDGMVTVAELLDYMIQLYRSRIAGVQRYQFLERKVVGQSELLSRSGSDPRVIPVANTQLVQNTPIKGVDTMIPGMFFLEKVMRGDHEAFKILTPPEKAALQADTLEAPSNAKPGELEAGRALMKDPALFFEALGMKGMAKDMRDQFETEKNDEHLFAEDVLEELLALKKVIDAEAKADLLAVDFGGKVKSKLRTLQVGWVRKGTLKFGLNKERTCKSRLGCTIQEIIQSFPKDPPVKWYAEREICLVWTVPRESFALANFALRQGIATEKGMWAQLWLPLSDELVDYVLAGASGSTVMSSEEDVDRPIRATVVFQGISEGGSSKWMVWDRVYGDFRTIGKGTGDGPEMNVPHRIREQLRSSICPDSVNLGNEIMYALSEDDSEEAEEPAMAGKGSDEDRCVTGLIVAKRLVTDRIRQKFQVNRPLPSAREEARMMYEEFGCMGQTSDDPNSPCYEK
jgi:hypothetical protein